MKLTLWTYEGPPHVGAMRVATAMRGLHYVLHAPQGDTYADLLFTMIERRGERPPVTYTTFQARDLGGDTATLFQAAAREAYERFRPQALLVGASCTAELIQDDPGGLARALGLPVPVVAVELPAYQKKENWGASETFYQLVRAFSPAAAPALTPSAAPASGPGPTAAAASGPGPTVAPSSTTPLSLATAPSSTTTLSPTAAPGPAAAPGPTFAPAPAPTTTTATAAAGPAATAAGRPPASSSAAGQPTRRPTCNLLGPTALGFRHRDDVAEITGLLDRLGVDVHVTAPLGATPADLARLGQADFNVVLYPETALAAAQWLQRRFGQPLVRSVPIGIGATQDFIREIADITGRDAAPVLAALDSRLPWYTRSVDSTYLTGKRVFIFADATHAIAAARIAAEELGFSVVGLGTYTREFAREVRAAAGRHGIEALITDDYLDVEAAITAAQPELVLGTQMERHIAKRLGIPCAVISAPVHVQDFPARYAPQMGGEGANVIFDTWVHPLMMGLEEHLLGMFREDFEFHDAAGASHLADTPATPPPAGEPVAAETMLRWDPAAEQELRKIPFFVRGKARRNTEKFALERSLANITLDTLYDAKAHFGR